MENSPFEIFIRECGTVEKAAKILGTSHQNISSMRNGRIWIKLGFAQKIAKYLWEQMRYKVDPLDLISPRSFLQPRTIFFRGLTINNN